MAKAWLGYSVGFSWAYCGRPTVAASLAWMFDEISARIWILLPVAVVAFAPLRYVYDHIVHSPERRDIVLPPEDLDWRTSGRLVRSLALLAALVAFALFIFTPTAEAFARSPAFVPILLSGLGAFAFFSVVQGLAKGSIEPLIRGISASYNRETQPRRFWASLSWNTLLGCGFLWLALTTTKSVQEDRCYDDQPGYTPQEALAACNSLIARNGNTEQQRADILAARGILHHKLGDYRSAVADYSAALALAPEDSYSFFNRGLAYDALGDSQKAFANYSVSLRMRPDNPGAYANRAIISLGRGEYDQAIADLTRAHELQPRDPWVIANRGMAHAGKGDRAAAEQDFETARTIDPSNIVWRRGEAFLNMQSGEMQEAVDHLTEILRQYPRDIWALRMRAEAYWKLGEKEKSQDDDDRVWQLEAEARSQARRS